MKINKELWGISPDGKEIYRYTIVNEGGAGVVLSSVGAGIVSINVPDREGKLADVVPAGMPTVSPKAGSPLTGRNTPFLSITVPTISTAVQKGSRIRCGTAA